MSDYTAEEDTSFFALYNVVIKDLCTIGGYTPADDNDDDDYDELYCPCYSNMPSVYILRPAPRTLALSAAEHELRDIVINSLADWEPQLRQLTPEKGVQYEAV